jgi:hypothetical protein
VAGGCELGGGGTDFPTVPGVRIPLAGTRSPLGGLGLVPLGGTTRAGVLCERGVGAGRSAGVPSGGVLDPGGPSPGRFDEPIIRIDRTAKLGVRGNSGGTGAMAGH